MIEFNIDECNKIHENKYNYQFVKFIHDRQKVNIYCPSHGMFQQTPYHHINRKQGCRRCQYEKLNKNFKLNDSDVVQKAKQIHNNKYNYSKLVYTNSNTPVDIGCPIHGNFQQTPYHHINRKQGCPKCRGNLISLLKRDTTEEFVTKSKNIHGAKYNYSKCEYVNMHTHVDIICPNHGVFSQTPTCHIHSKNGCPKCGYNVSKQESEWLDSLNIPVEFRQKVVTIDGTRFKVDAYDKENKTIYEFFGYFWHGHPDFFNPLDVNPKNKIGFGELYNKTLKKIHHIKSNGFSLIEKWG